MKSYYETKNGVLYHGDCLDIMPLLEPVDLLIADPPYGVKWQSNWRSDKFAILKNDDTPHTEWLSAIKTRVVYVFTKWNVMQYWVDAMIEKSIPVRNVLVWDKLSHGAGDLKSWAPTYELIIYATVEPIALEGGRPQNVLRHWRVDAGATGKSSKKLLCHPCQKPESLYIQIIKHHKTNCILDPFLGSGTTAVACERLNRRWIGIEISEKYCELAAKRIENEARQLKLFT